MRQWRSPRWVPARWTMRGARGYLGCVRIPARTYRRQYPDGGDRPVRSRRAGPCRSLADFPVTTAGRRGRPAVNPHPSLMRMPQRVVWIRAGYPSITRRRRESALSSMAESTVFANPGRRRLPPSHGSVTGADPAAAQSQVREGEGLSRTAGIGLGGAISIEGRKLEVRTWETSA